jgi:hypothetical protein
MTKGNLSSYKRIVGKDAIERIRTEGETLKGKHFLSINSTYQGGGVAEIQNSIVILFVRQPS